MNLEQALQENTVAITQLTAAIQGQVAAPTAPTLVAPQVPVAATPPVGVQAPFTDAPGLTQYVMAAYNAMGPDKGAQIQGVLTNAGFTNINEVTPDKYGVIYTGIEALKNG